MKKIKSKIEVLIKSLPKSPGVYLMKSDDGKVIYVGKAVNLSNRVRSYFNRELTEIKTVRLVEKIEDIEWMVTETELEALMLETTLIKKYRPKYNILMKDDKNYVYIKITDEMYPRVLVVRSVQKGKDSYFGPYTNGLTVKKVLRSLNRIFPFYTYQNKSGVAPMNSVAGAELFVKRSQTAWGDVSNEDVYKKMIDDLKKFLRGNSSGVVKLFKGTMERASEEKNYEQAAILRDRIRDIDQITEGQRVVSTKKDNIDVIGLFGEAKKWIVSLIVVRSGKMIDVKNVEVSGSKDNDKKEVLARFVIDYYERSQDIPKVVYLSEELEQKDLLLEYVTKTIGQKIKFVFPQKGDKKKMVGLAEKNAKMEYLRKKSIISFARNEGLGIVDLLSHLHKLDWDEYRFDEVGDVFRIEGYDISNLGDTGVVGALVVWELVSQKSKVKSQKGKKKKTKEDNKKEEIKKWKGKFNKSLYKRFEIKTTVGQDDFGAMKEVFERRFANEKKSKKNWVYPNLILVDGGKGQLGVVLRVLKDLDIEVPVISLAKREEEIWVGRKSEDIGYEYEMLEIDKSELSNLLMQNIRNEVHRFAVSYQRIVRKKGVRKSILDQVEGLGPKTKKKLLKEFGSVKGIVEAGKEKVSEYVGKKLTTEIFKLL